MKLSGQLGMAASVTQLTPELMQMLHRNQRLKSLSDAAASVLCSSLGQLRPELKLSHAKCDNLQSVTLCVIYDQQQCSCPSQLAN